MKNLKRVLVLVLSLIMVFSLAACSGGSDNGTNDNGDASNEGTNNEGNTNNGNEEGNNSGAGSELATQEFVTQAGQNQDGQVDNVVIAMSSTSVNVGPFAPNSPGSVGKSALYGKLFFQPYFGAPIEECIPWLASGYEQIDDVTYRVTLYDYITDSKGNQITADDVIWSGQTSMEIGQFVDYGAYVESVEKEDDYTIVFHMTSNAPNLFASIVTSMNFCIVDQEWYENASDEERSTDPATTSAYTVKEFVSGSRAVLEARDDYWQTDDALNEGVLPAYQNVKTVTYTAITEASMRVIALQNGEVDVAPISSTDLGNFYDINSGENLDGWTVLRPAPTYVQAIFPNMSDQSIVGQNLDLRKAIFHALDAESIMMAAGESTATSILLNAFANPRYLGYQEEWDQEEYWPYDPALASEYLASAGYEPGEVTITLLTSSGLYTDSVRSVIISQLNAVGINVENLSVEQALFSTYKNDKTMWDLMMDLKSSTTGHIAGLYSYNFAAENYAEGQGGVNFWIDDGVYELVKRINNDPSDANILEMEQYLRDNAAILGLYGNSVLNVAQDGIEELSLYSGTQMEPAAFVFADDYVSAAG